MKRRHLGVVKPQIVTSFGADEVLRYIWDYPITEFVRDSIQIFWEAIAPIEVKLESENRESELQNAEIHAQIDRYEAQLVLLKEADMFFTERDHYNPAHAFAKARQDLFANINTWRNRKTKVVGDDECATAAASCDADVSRFMTMFADAAERVCRLEAVQIRSRLHEAYSKQGMDLDYAPSQTHLQPMTQLEPISLHEEMLSMKQITFEEQKLDFKALFRMRNSTGISSTLM